MSRLGIVSALAAEARHLCPAPPRMGAITRLACGALLIVSGMGPAAASLAASALREAGATALLSFGLAGALDPALHPGTVCLPCAVISREGLAVATALPWRDTLRTVLAARCVVTGGKLLSSPVTLDTVAEKAQAFQETGAVLVDMESLAVGQVAARHELPFMAVRVVVDTARDRLPLAVTRTAGPSGEVPLLALLGALARRPGELPAVIRLGARYRVASRSLAAVAASGSLAPQSA